MLAPRHLIFTDLEGLLLDPHSHACAATEWALAELERRHIPLVLVTGKTRAEVEVLRRKLGHAHPFVTENGGGIFIPDGYFNLRIEEAQRAGRYLCVPLGQPYPKVVEILEEIAAEAGVEVAGLHQMSVREVAQNMGISPREAGLVRQRDFEELFFFAGARDPEIARFLGAAQHRGVRVTRRGRFWHAGMGGDPGAAAKRLMKLYRSATRLRLRAVGLGDSDKDLPLLAAVDHRILLPKPDGSFDAEVLAEFPQIERGSHPGPKGWSDAVLHVLELSQ